MTNIKQVYTYIVFLTLVLYVINMKAQTSVGIFNQAITVAPSYTLSSGSSFFVSGSVINTGNTSISNNVHVNLGIDTSSTGTPKYAWRSTTTYSVSNFLPNNTFTFAVTDLGTPANGYKTNGNGTTIIVWPIVASITNTTSVRDSAYSIIYITLPSGINDITQFENTAIIIQNPASEILNIEFEMLSESIQVTLIDVNGLSLINKTIDPSLENYHLTVNIQHFTKGIYYLKFYNKAINKVVTKKIIIN